jgi:hypothetical protein
MIADYILKLDISESQLPEFLKSLERRGFTVNRSQACLACNSDENRPARTFFQEVNENLVLVRHVCVVCLVKIRTSPSLYRQILRRAAATFMIEILRAEKGGCQQ